MNKKLNIDKNIAEFIEEFPETKEVFELFGLDYKSFAQEKITVAAKEKDIKIEDLISSLNKKITQKTNFLEKKTLSETISYVEKTHHAFLWENLPSTDMLFASLMNDKITKSDTFLLGLKRMFDTLKNHLELHLEKEEYNLFAMVKERESHPRRKNKAPADIIISKINALYEDHDRTNLLLGQMREYTNNFEAPDDACAKLQEIYKNLKAIENDLYEHVYIENAILMPKIKALLIK